MRPIEAAAPAVPSAPGRRGLLRRLVVVAILAIIGTAVLFAVPELRGVVREIGGMNPGWFAVAVVLEIASCLGFVVVFRLFFDGVPAAPAREVAWVEMASGVLLPGGGVGGLAAGGWLLRTSGMATDTIVQRSSGLFLLTSAVNVLTLGTAGLLVLVGASAGPDAVLLTVVPVVVAVVVLSTFWTLPRMVGARRARSGLGSDLFTGIELAKAPLKQPNWRLVGALAYLICDIAVLWAAFAALGLHPPIAALVLGYLVGFLANLVPVPGGIGVLDAGLVAALALYGLPVEASAAAVLVYHVIAFWLPGLGGSLAYALFRRRLTAGGGRLTR